MTNQPNDELFSSDRDMTPEDLHLVAEKAFKRQRDTVSVDSEEQPPDLLIRPGHRHKKIKKKHPVRTALIIFLLCLLGIVVAAAVTVLILQQFGRSQLLPDASVTLTAPENIAADPSVSITDNGRTVTYKGVTYRFNENRTNILCVGVDKEQLGLENDVVGTGGQADTIILLSIDTKSGDMDALAVSRDTLADIDLFAEDGSYIGTKNTQICLAYAYGDGREISCDAMTRAVSRLLYGVPINTYFAIDLNSIATLNDAIGGVELTALGEFRRADGSTVHAGEVVYLYGEDALRYIRARDIEQLDSNNARMERQTQYLSAFADKALSAAKSDLQVPLNLYQTVTSDSVTNLNPSKITFLTTSLIQHNQPLSFHTVSGTVIKSEENGSAALIVDETALYEQVLDIFYTKE